MTDPVTALLLGTLVFGLGAVVGLMSRRADTYAPAPGFHEPPRHVAPVRFGTCHLCGTEGPVEAVRPGVLSDHVDMCRGCKDLRCTCFREDMPLFDHHLLCDLRRGDR